MRVLLALADANGAVLNREDLIVSCWDSLVVGDDAINRTIAELRRISRATGAGYIIETVPRVGYRLVRAAPDQADPPGSSLGLRFSRRRKFMLGMASLVVVGGVTLLIPRRPTNARAAALRLRGEQALRDELPDSLEQGIGFLREAAALEEDARGAGLLALALRNVSEHAPESETAAAVNDCEAAVQRALSLDPKEPNALAARATLLPAYGDWAAAEHRLRDVLAVAPNHPYSLSALGYLMESVGRSRLSAQLTARAAEIEPLSPVFQYRLAYKLWIAGRVREADQVIDRAMQLWPRHPAVNFARFLLFVWTARYEPALAFLSDTERGGAIMPPPATALWRLSIQALATQDLATVEQAKAAQLSAARASAGSAVMAIQVLSLLSNPDAAFAVANGYLLRQGAVAGSLSTSPTQLTVNDQRWRKTAMLFVPTTAALRDDSRFGTLVQAIGLGNYWRSRGVTPDYLVR
jgi:tetratricopeptide (TPR) repeat protein